MQKYILVEVAPGLVDDDDLTVRTEELLLTHMSYRYERLDIFPFPSLSRRGLKKPRTKWFVSHLSIDIDRRTEDSICTMERDVVVYV